MQTLLLRNVPFLVLFALTLAHSGISQPPPPPPPPRATGSAPVKKWETPSLAALKTKEPYGSWKGRFSIALSSSAITSYSAGDLNSGEALRNGETYTWEFREGTVIVQYYDDSSGRFASFSPEQQEQALVLTLNSGIERAKGSEVVAEMIKLGSIPGRKARFNTSTGAILARNFLDGSRLYLLVGAVARNVKDAERQIESVLDSFRILPPAEIETDIAKALNAATPKPLPQSPAAAKEKSDAEDSGFIGKVKTVIEESENLIGATPRGSRHRSSVTDFNENGNRTKHVSYESAGIPFSVTVYGFIDGARASDSELVEGGAATIVAVGGPPDTTRRDPRYEFKLQYKYSGGRLSEEKMFGNDGKLWMAYAYKYAGDLKTELVYDEDGELNQKYAYKMDAKGNPIEYRVYDMAENWERVESVTRYSYLEFDEKGNWTKRSVVNVIKENSVERAVPSEIEYRTITYYP
ncbi:MAG: hypothetical protein QUS14_00875 [Pyrinomonadaceae bacterium]|nr:hypothetical protein [Pyrinomonadaceae bacterium]